VGQAKVRESEMSSSYNCEENLRELANKLRIQASDLETAANTLAVLRDSNMVEKEIKAAKQWAKDWMKS